tara:strand:+ start:289 stop:798 length:510 start_codon:yes stop_codon:yes gene_type:complete
MKNNKNKALIKANSSAIVKVENYLKLVEKLTLENLGRIPEIFIPFITKVASSRYEFCLCNARDKRRIQNTKYETLWEARCYIDDKINKSIKRKSIEEFKWEIKDETYLYFKNELFYCSEGYFLYCDSGFKFLTPNFGLAELTVWDGTGDMGSVHFVGYIDTNGFCYWNY